MAFVTFIFLNSLFTMVKECHIRKIIHDGGSTAAGHFTIFFCHAFVTICQIDERADGTICKFDGDGHIVRIGHLRIFR